MNWRPKAKQQERNETGHVMSREEFSIQVKGEQEQLRRFLLALCCGNMDKADDIAQESLVKAYLSLGKYNETGNFAAWLYKIAYRTFLDHGRSSNSTQPLEQATNICDSGNEADGAFCYQELYMALDTLPAHERTSLLLFYIKGYSVKEISHITDSSEEAVKKQLSRGRDHLKTRMKR